MYAADVCANVYKANLLTDIVSKVMPDVLLPEMRNCLHSCLKMKLYRITGVQSVVMNEFSSLFSLVTQEARLALGYRLVRLLRFFRAWQPPACIHNSIVRAMAFIIC